MAAVGERIPLELRPQVDAALAWYNQSQEIPFEVRGDPGVGGHTRGEGPTAWGPRAVKARCHASRFGVLAPEQPNERQASPGWRLLISASPSWRLVPLRGPSAIPLGSTNANPQEAQAPRELPRPR